MDVRLGAWALGAGLALTLTHAALADPEVLVKCDGAGPAQRYTNADKWQPMPNPDRSIVITRDKGKLSMELTGDQPITSHAVFALPQHNITTFRVLGRDGVQNFHVVQGLYSGKPELHHNVFGARDGSGVFNMRDSTLTDCSVISPDVAVEKAGAGTAEAPKR